METIDISPNTTSAVAETSAVPSLDSIVQKMTAMRQQTERNQMRATNEIATGADTEAEEKLRTNGLFNPGALDQTILKDFINDDYIKTFNDQLDESKTLLEDAKKNFFKVPRVQGTIPHPITGEAAAGVVMLRPASAGTGVIAGGPVRAVLEAAGIHDVLTKSLGSGNAINVVHATVDALKKLERPEQVASRRGLTVEHVVPAAILKAQAAEKAGV